MFMWMGESESETIDRFVWTQMFFMSSHLPVFGFGWTGSKTGKIRLHYFYFVLNRQIRLDIDDE